MINPLFILFALVLSNLVYAKPLNNIVVFGDSLSDNGNLYKLQNLPPSPPYYAGRFSNGPVWVEKLAEACFPKNGSAHLQDYAFGGAAIIEEEDDIVFSLKLEVATYLSAHQDKADENSLFILWIGANNYLMAPPNVEETLTQVNTGIRHGLQRLVKAGAKHIMLVSLPDLGNSPFPKEFYSEDEIPFIREKLSLYSRRHNELLVDMINELKQSNSDIQWLYFDAGSKVKEVLDAPENYGIRNTTDACYATFTENSTKRSLLSLATNLKPEAEQTEPDHCNTYLFFDGVHPTTSAHKILAEQAKALLDSEGIEFLT